MNARIASAFVVAAGLGCMGGFGLVQVLGDPPEIHSEHFFYGYPLRAPASNDLIIRELYALSSNDETKLADWVAYRLTRETVAKLYETYRYWQKDPWLDPSETLEPEDYEGAHEALQTDRGHLAPLGSFTGSNKFWSLNYLSNIAPQKSALNRGPWLDLERAVRSLVRDMKKPAWVMTGPLYEAGGMCPSNDPQTLCLPGADEPHRIPSGYWKIVAIGERRDPTTVRVSGFAFSQDTAGDFRDGLTSIDELERRSGLDFFWQLPVNIEAAVEKETTNLENLR